MIIMICIMILRLITNMSIIDIIMSCAAAGSKKAAPVRAGT